MRPARCAMAYFAGIAIAATLLFANAVSGQSARTIRIIVPFPPAGGVDILARLLADQISHTHNPVFVIENRPGAGSMIGTEAAARAAPDGNTVLFAANSFIVVPSLRKAPYDPLKSFEPVCLLTRSPNVIVVNAASPYQSLRDLIEAARAKPGTAAMAFQGPGTGQHIATEELKRVAKIEMTNVPFTGSGPAVNAILGNHVSALFVNYPAVAEHVKAGKLRALATASRNRIASLPNVPTIAEIVQQEFEHDVWTGALMPAETSREAISELADWFRSAVLAPDVQPKLAAQGFEAAGICGAPFADFLRRRVEDYGRIIREANIRTN
jgi:tripartite-type tricarboxylate transporter receptor subunit TctC